MWGITINTPADSPNTDGVDPSRAKNGVIAYTKITTGDDNIAVKGGGPNPVDGLLVAHNHFGRGHGMSIGSETNGGVRNVSVCDLSLDGTDNGLRIKSDASRGGLVQGIYYTDVCIRDSRHPLVFDSYYSSATGTLIPDFRDISVNNVHVLGTGGIDTFRGWDAAHPIGITLNNVVFDEAPTSINAQYSNLTFGPQARQHPARRYGGDGDRPGHRRRRSPRLQQRVGDLLDFVIGSDRPGACRSGARFSAQKRAVSRFYDNP